MRVSFLGCHVTLTGADLLRPAVLPRCCDRDCLGFTFPGPKQDAILRGDLSDTVVHPYFTHAMAGLGMYFCAGVEHSPRMVILRAKHAQRALEQVAEIAGGSDASLTVQVLFSLTSMTLHSRWIDSARKCLTKTCIALNAANLRFIPAIGRPPVLQKMSVSELWCSRKSFIWRVTCFWLWMERSQR